MKMYVSILRIRDKWEIHSPDVNLLKEIDEDDFHNGDLVKYVEGSKLSTMPRAKMPVIVATKQYLLERGEDYRICFVACVPLEFNVRSRDGVIERSNPKD